MNIIIVLLIITTVAQVVVCHFSFWWLLALIARTLFAIRIIGATIKTKISYILEGVGIAIMFLFYTLFMKGNFPWLRFGLFILFSAISCGLMALDSILYVYVTEDDVEED